MVRHAQSFAGFGDGVGVELRKAWIDFLEPSEGIDDRCLVKILPELSPNEGFLTVTIGQQFLAIFSYFYVAPLLGAAEPC